MTKHKEHPDHQLHTESSAAAPAAEQPPKKKKSTLFTTLLLVAALLVGLGLLLYPTFSDYWNKLHQSHAIASYAEQVADLSKEQYKEMLEEARRYNADLLTRGNKYHPTEEEMARYNATLDVTGTGIMGYIEIPKVNVSLPIYHGTDEGALQIAIGHIEWSSLPVGGASTHAVLSGHRGLPSARLFTDIDKMAEGDTFVIRVLDETFTYAVDQIRIVWPNELQDLQIEEGKDLVTLVTCTPYGVNDHRLLVRGHRVENAKEASEVRVTADAMQIEPIMMTPLVAAPMLLVLLIVLMLRTRKRR